MELIPKTIQYCWFGRGEKTELAINCINSWKEKLPDYQIIEWNEDNYPIKEKCQFVKDAYKDKAYAFVSDYARFDILYNNGGFYLDVDVEVLKDFESLRSDLCLMGFQDSTTVAPGLIIGSIPRHHLMKEMMNLYEELHYFVNGAPNKTPIGVYTNDVLTRNGIKINGETQKGKDFIIYSEEYFSPINCRTLKKNITKNSYSIHYYQGSWLNEKDLKYLKFTKRIRGRLGDNKLSAVVIYICDFGRRVYFHLKRKIHM